MNYRSIASVSIILILSSLSPSVMADVSGINQNGGLAVNVWADGTWYMRAIQVDDMGDAVGSLSPETSFPLTSMAPFIDPVLTVDVPDGHFIWFYRSQTAGISVGDTGVEVYKFECTGGTARCDMADTNNIFMSDSLFSVDGDVLPVELMSFEVD